ncbi:MAG: hypothetical protein U1E02_37350, partial [Hydrogenophaga sp.]|nr:hypothetical protein [Hydrogenophaga sp.]
RSSKVCKAASPRDTNSRRPGKAAGGCGALLCKKDGRRSGLLYGLRMQHEGKKGMGEPKF